MSNVIDKAYVVILESKDRTFIEVTPMIFLSLQSAENFANMNQDIQEFATVFKAKTYIDAYVNTHWKPIKIVA